MKKFSTYVLLLVFLSVSSIRCSSGSNLLKTGSSLLSALGGNANLSSITSLLQTPGLDKLLGGVMKKPFTLLAPTNDALNSLGAGAVSSLSDPNNVGQLADLLKDHIIPGKQDATSLAQGATAASGKSLDLGGVNLGSLISDDKFNIIPVDKVLGR